MAHRMGRKRWEYNLKVNTNASESYIKTQEQRGERERELHCGDKIENQKLILRSPERQEKREKEIIN